MSHTTPQDPTRIITRPGQRVYHLDLAAGEIADLIITVGDPARVQRIVRHLDQIELERSYREFRTVTGRIGSKAITVLSTGMGADNIDIVLNELELLANWNLAERRPTDGERRSLQIVRLGTSGALQPDLSVDSLLLSRFACSVDVLHRFYPIQERKSSLEKALAEHAKSLELPRMLLFQSDDHLYNTLTKIEGMQSGLTYTASGFYAPQGRELWHAADEEKGLLDGLAKFVHEGHRITNVEMETAALFHLGAVFGHQMASVSCLLANRPRAAFSTDPDAAVDRMIRTVLDKLV